MKTSTPTDTLLSTRDIFLATTFKLHNLALLKVEDAGGRCIFTFSNSEKAKQITTQYFNGELRLDPKRLFEEWKNLKSLAYSTTNFLK